MTDPKDAQGRIIQVVAAVMVQDGKVLVAQRPEGCKHGGKWEFPGGKIDAGETPEEALSRELAEELGIHAHISEFLGEVIHQYSTATILLQAFRVSSWKGQITLLEHQKIVFVKPEELAFIDMTDADRQLLGIILRHL